MLYLYLYQPLDGDEYQSDLPPNHSDIEAIIDNELAVYRIEAAMYVHVRCEKLVPIDGEDVDSWNEIPFASK